MDDYKTTEFSLISFLIAGRIGFIIIFTVIEWVWLKSSTEVKLLIVWWEVKEAFKSSKQIGCLMWAQN